MKTGNAVRRSQVSFPSNSHCRLRTPVHRIYAPYSIQRSYIRFAMSYSTRYIVTWTKRESTERNETFYKPKHMFRFSQNHIINISIQSDDLRFNLRSPSLFLILSLTLSTSRIAICCLWCSCAMFKRMHCGSDCSMFISAVHEKVCENTIALLFVAVAILRDGLESVARDCGEYS